MGYSADLDNYNNLIAIVRRLPMHLRGKWSEKADTIIESGHEPTFRDLTLFIERSARVATMMYGQDLRSSGQSNTKKSNDKNPKTRATALTTTQQNTPVIQPPTQTTGQRTTPSTHINGNAMPQKAHEDQQKCSNCNGRHDLSMCKSFLDMTYGDRCKLTREKGLCDNCLRRGHLSRQCKQVSRCTVSGCTWKHPTLLHPPSAPVQNADTTENEEQSSAFSTQSGSNQVLLRVVPVHVHTETQTVQTYALLDECCAPKTSRQ
jgi:hypothetical protein